MTRLERIFLKRYLVVYWWSTKLKKKFGWNNFLKTYFKNPRNNQNLKFFDNSFWPNRLKVKSSVCHIYIKTKKYRGCHVNRNCIYRVPSKKCLDIHLQQNVYKIISYLEWVFKFILISIHNLKSRHLNFSVVKYICLLMCLYLCSIVRCVVYIYKYAVWCCKRLR